MSRHELFGLRVRFEGAIARCCGSTVAVINQADGPHFGKLTCDSCGVHRGWLSKSTADWITAVINKFGAPTTPIVLRRHPVPCNRTEKRRTIPAQT
jgi:hypothetical protein